MLCGRWNPLITGFEIIKLVAELFSLDLSKPTAFAVDLGPYSITHILSFLGVKDVLCARKVCRAFHHETHAEHVWLKMYQHLSWTNMSFKLSASMAPVRVYEQGKWAWEDLEGSFRRMYEFYTYNCKKGVFRHNSSFYKFVYNEHKALCRPSRHRNLFLLYRRPVGQNRVERRSQREAKRRDMLALMAPLIAAYNAVATSHDARQSSEIAISKLALQSFYKLNGIFATALLARFRRTTQVGNLVDVLDVEDRVWRVGTVEKNIGTDNAEQHSIVISLNGFGNEHNITVSHSEFSQRLFPYRWHTKNILYPHTTLSNPLVQHVRSTQSKKRTFSDFEGTITILVSNLTFPAVKLVLPYGIGISDAISEYYRITGASYTPHPALTNCNWYVQVNDDHEPNTEARAPNTAARASAPRGNINFVNISNFGNISVENLYNRKVVVKTDNNMLHLLCSLVINSNEICKHKCRLRRRVKPLLKRFRVTVRKIFAIRFFLGVYFRIYDAAHGAQRNLEVRIRRSFRRFQRASTRMTSIGDGR